MEAELKRVIRDFPDYPKPGIVFKDISPILMDMQLYTEVITSFAKRIQDLNIDPFKVNIDGGAIALGHPLGATGSRITAKAAQLLKREKKKFALVTQCIGLGQGIATVLENY